MCCHQADRCAFDQIVSLVHVMELAYLTLRRGRCKALCPNARKSGRHRTMTERRSERSSGMSGEKRKMSVGLVEGLKMTTSIQNAIYPVAGSVPFPCDVLTRERLAWIQRREATATLVSLTMLCRDRYHYALRLIHPGRPVPETARFPPNETVACLLPAWDWLCCWYRDVQFDPQLDLFTCPWRGELDRWYRFVRDRCEAVMLCASAMSQTYFGYAVRSAAQSRNVERKPCTVAS